MFQSKKDLQAMLDALPATERNALLGVKGHSTSPSKLKHMVSSSSNEAIPIVVDASDDHVSERTTNSGGDEKQTAPRKPGRPKTAVDPGKAVEKAEKVSQHIFDISYLIITYSRKNGSKSRQLKPRRRGKSESPKRNLGH